VLLGVTADETDLAWFAVALLVDDVDRVDASSLMPAAPVRFTSTGTLVLPFGRTLRAAA
jgi:hypothetical protein